MTTIAHPCLEVQTSAASHPAVPPWFAETRLLAQYLRPHGLLEALARQVRRIGRTEREEGERESPSDGEIPEDAPAWAEAVAGESTEKPGAKPLEDASLVDAGFALAELGAVEVAGGILA